ncbi:uncharacterized protein Dsimw501_GD29163 [Drosophila simulans]|uniref:Uncharacterized protein n=1 Tax=Drosophila simulans TaxID=7240 RepID=A0A0J9R177_DROSI|nr:uncharacterized protein Dsimw501_GD29163 [Drosophila simulans]
MALGFLLQSHQPSFFSKCLTSTHQNVFISGYSIYRAYPVPCILGQLSFDSLLLRCVLLLLPLLCCRRPAPFVLRPTPSHFGCSSTAHDQLCQPFAKVCRGIPSERPCLLPDTNNNNRKLYFHEFSTPPPSGAQMRMEAKTGA